MKPRAANVLPLQQANERLPTESAVAPPALLPYAAAEPALLSSLPTRLGLMFAALVVPALLATVAWGMPDRKVRTFASAGAALFGATALVCCTWGYRRDRRSKIGLARRGPAAAWVLVGCITLGSAGIVIGGGAALLRATSRTYGYSSRHHCQRNLRQVSMAILMYAQQNNGRLPDSLDDVLRAGDITSDVFICPMQAANPPRGGTTPYAYLGKGKKNDVGPEVVLLHDRPVDHEGGMNFGYGDGHQEWHDLKTSKKILAELDAGYNPPRPEKLK